MKLISTLPFNQQSKPVRQQLLADLRDLNRTHKIAFDLPRIRIRSLDVIPLSLSLPRHTSLSSVTAALNPLASVSSWASLSVATYTSPLTTPLISSLRSFCSATSSPYSLSKLPPLLTWHPASLKTIHQTPSLKMNHILKLSPKHICFLLVAHLTYFSFNSRLVDLFLFQLPPSTYSMTTPIFPLWHRCFPLDFTGALFFAPFETAFFSVFDTCWYLWTFACFCTHLMFNISFCCCRHNISNIFVLLTQKKTP